MFSYPLRFCDIIERRNELNGGLNLASSLLSLWPWTCIHLFLPQFTYLQRDNNLCLVVYLPDIVILYHLAPACHSDQKYEVSSLLCAKWDTLGKRSASLSLMELILYQGRDNHWTDASVMNAVSEDGGTAKWDRSASCDALPLSGEVRNVSCRKWHFKRLEKWEEASQDGNGRCLE